MAVVGEKEASHGSVTLRDRDTNKDLGVYTVNDLVTFLKSKN